LFPKDPTVSAGVERILVEGWEELEALIGTMKEEERRKADVTLDRSGVVHFRNVVHSNNVWWGGKKTVVFTQRKRALYAQYVARCGLRLLLGLWTWCGQKSSNFFISYDQFYIPCEFERTMALT
jgi:hypothetical protein